MGRRCSRRYAPSARVWPRCEALRTNWEAAREEKVAVQDTGSGMTSAKMIRVTRVEPLDGYQLRVRFANGETRDVDVARYLRGPVFEPIRKDRALL
jgi:hypothetical protein